MRISNEVTLEEKLDWKTWVSEIKGIKKYTIFFTIMIKVLDFNNVLDHVYENLGKKRFATKRKLLIDGNTVFNFN